MSKITVIDLGWCMAKLEVDKKRLTIVSPAYVCDNWQSPVQEVVILQEGIIALRNALNAESAIENYYSV